MEEGHLHFLISLLGLSEEHKAALQAASEHSLDETAAFQNAVVVPLDLEHAPVLLDVDSGEALLVPPLLGLTGNKVSGNCALTL
jgi:hypothetical protein